MKLRPLRISFLAVLLLALVAAASACGGDGASPLERYFQQLEDTRDELNQRFTTLQDEFETALTSGASDAAVTEAARDYYGGNLSALEDAISRVEEVEPPAEIAEAEQSHEEFVAAMKDLALVFEDLSARAESAASVSELEDSLAEVDRGEFDAVTGRFGQACLALQGIADANGVAADLGCEG